MLADTYQMRYTAQHCRFVGAGHCRRTVQAKYAQLFQPKTGRLRQPQVRIKGPIRDFTNATLNGDASLLLDPVPLIIIDDTWDDTDVQQWRMQTNWKNL